MKKQIKKIICFALFVVAYGCSSGQHVVDKEISLDELMKLEGKPAVLKVDTKDTLFNNISSWEIRDSSLAFPDYGKNYAEKISEYRVNKLGDLGKQKNQEIPKYYKYPKPDTLLIPFKSINKIEYSGNVSQNGSEDILQLSGGGYELDARKNELTLGLFVENQIGLYRPIIEFNTTLNNSKDKLRISSSALYSLGYMFVGLILESAITGDPIVPGATKKEDNSDNTIIWAIISLPLLVTNAEHHIYILDPSNSNSDNSIGLSVFGGFRLDIYDSEWIVYSPETGIQIGHYWGKNDFGGYNNSMDFQIAVEYPYEDRLNEFQEPKISAGIKFKFL